MAQATQQSLGTFLTLIENMRQVPHPQAPDLPLLADPKLDLTPYIYRALDFLKRELTYAGQYSDTTGSGDPASLDPIERARADAGLPIAPAQSAPASYQIPSAPQRSKLPTDGPVGPDSQPMAAGIRASQRQLEREADLPTPGSLLNADPSGGAYAGRGMAGLAPVAFQAAPSVSGQPTSMPQVTQAYSPTQAPSYSSEQNAVSSDEYLASLSRKS